MSEVQKAKRARKGKAVAVVDPSSGRLINKVATKDGALHVTAPDGAQAELDRLFGTGSRDFVGYSMAQVANLVKQGPNGDITIPFNAALAFISAIGPRDELEAALAAQMFATHHLSMETARRTHNADQIPQFDANGGMMVKLQRTFLMQLEGLGKHRRGGKQYVVHQHVNVNEGGQAVVAHTVNSGGGHD